MIRSRFVLAGLLAAALIACGPTISGINQRPTKFYQKQVSFSGRIARVQALADETLLEVEDPNGARILVRVAGTPEASTGDWVKVHGIFVPEARVGGQVLYDVVQAEEVNRRRAPRFRNLT